MQNVLLLLLNALCRTSISFSMYKLISCSQIVQQQQPQLIEEQRQEDAILKIYLKRVLHKSLNESTSSSSSYSVDTLIKDADTKVFVRVDSLICRVRLVYVLFSDRIKPTMRYKPIPTVAVL
jgi:hypothetical protein